MLKRALILSLLLNVVFIVLLFVGRDRLPEKVLREERNTSELERKARKETPSTVTPSPVSVVHKIETPQTSLSLNAVEPQKRSTWRAERAVNSIARYIALGNDQRVSLLERFEQEGAMTNERRHEILGEMLGEEAASEYEARREAEWENERREELEQEVFTLSRQLNLNQEQEAQVRRVLSETAEQLKPQFLALRRKSEEAIALHDEGDGAKLRESYREMRALMESFYGARRELLSEALRGMLSDEQMNFFLEKSQQSIDPFAAE
jgi:hypothetical protein